MGAKVLLLEDDVPFACEVKDALALVGCNVEVVRDGNAGLARAVSSRFDLIVASVELPGMNGFRLVNRLRKAPLAHHAPIFLVSAQPSSVFDEHRKLPTRAESYFQKPIVMAELIAQVRVTLPGLGDEAKDPASAGGIDASPFGDFPGSSGDEWTDFIDDAFNDVTGTSASSGTVETGSRGADASALDLLRGRIAEHEETNVRLLRELGEARAAVEAATTSRAEALARTTREVELWKQRALNANPSGPHAVAHDELALRQQVVRKDAKIARLTQDLDQAAHANRELKEKAARLEGDLPVLKESLADLGRQNAEMEKLVSAARADKEQATRRALDLSRRLERVRPDIEQAEQALAQERADREAQTAEHARVVAEIAAQREAERSQAERLRTDELSARNAAHAKETRELRTKLESTVRSLERELSDLRTRLENERNEAASREQTLREDFLRESRSLRAEHVDAIAVAESALVYKQAILRHEFEAAEAKLKEHAVQKLQAAEAMLADQTRSASRRAAEAEQRFQHDLGEALRRTEALEQTLVAERAARAEQLAAHASAMSEVSAERARERAAAEEREVALRAQTSETLAARSRSHAQELQQFQLESERTTALLRQELADTEARRKADLSATATAHAAEIREHAAELERIRAEQEQATGAAETRYQESLAAVRSGQEASIQLASETAEEQIRRASEEFGARERELRDAMAALEERYQAERRAAESAAGDLRDALRLERQGRADDAAVHAARVAEVAKASDAELGQHLDRFRAEQERKDAELRDQLATQYQQELARSREAHESKLSALEQGMAERHALAQRELDAAEAKWRQEKEAALRAKEEELVSSHEQTLSAIERAKNDEIAAARQQGIDARREAEDRALERLRQVEAEREARAGALEAAMAELERERDRLTEALRAAEGGARALESERDGGVVELESYREKLAVLSRRHEAELGQAQARVQELETLHAATVEARDAAAAEELQRARASHERAVASLEDQLNDSKAEIDRMRADAAAFESRMRQEADTRDVALAAANADALASAERRFEAQLADAVRQGEERLAALRQDGDRKLAGLEAELEQKLRESSEAALENAARESRDTELDLARDAAVAENMVRFEHALREKDRELYDLRAERARETSELARAHEAALTTERAKASREAKKEADARFENEIGQAMLELRTELEVERAQTLGQMERAHSVALRRVMENGDRERTALSSRVAELTQALAGRSMDAAPDVEERERATSASIERFEALARSRTEDVVRLQRELEEARAEAPALEAEVAALRTELTSMRLKLDDQTILATVSKEELENDRRRLGNAEKALAAALARIRGLESSNGTS